MRHIKAYSAYCISPCPSSIVTGVFNYKRQQCSWQVHSTEIQVDRSDTSSSKIGKLQVLQNEAVRVKRRCDKVSKTDLLNQCNTTSVNHIGAGAVLQEINRASHNCSSIMEQYQFDRNSRSRPTLRTSKDPKSIESKSAKAVDYNSNKLQNWGSQRQSS